MSKGKDTWLTPASLAWEAKFGKGTFPFGKAARAFKPLFPHYTPDEIGERLAVYLDTESSRFLSLPRFAETFGEYAPKPIVDPDTGLLTEYGERLTRPSGER